MKHELNHENTWDVYRAAAFYVINKCSFSGLTESSSFSQQASVSNFSMRGIDKLPEYSKLIKNWKITNNNYWDMMLTPAPVNTFWFLDPPYDIKDNLYGKKGELHKGFNHEEFHAYMTQGNIKDDWMITYNTNPTLMEWYKNYYQTKWDLTYTMRSVGDYMNEQKDRAELLITNYDFSQPQ
jgi:DNA adenine methylase